jgi:glycosyltransferase involved in cell wall biosynthesis
MTSPLLSIIVPSFNQGRFIRETIDSALAQSYRPIEVLVFDGGSTDDTVEVLRSYGELPELRWWSEPDKGVVDAVNKGFARAAGEIIAVQSSDDVYMPGAFETAVRALEADHSLALVYGDMELIDADSTRLRETSLSAFDLYDYISKLTYIPQPTAFFRREAMAQAGPWRADISYAADAEFYLRIVQAAPVRKLDATLGRYRVHEEQRDKAGLRIIRDWSAAVAPLLESEDRNVRRAARIGVELVGLHYTPRAQWVARTGHLYRAIALRPALLMRSDIRAHHELIPLRVPLWSLLSRIKRMLGIAPRSAPGGS